MKTFCLLILTVVILFTACGVYADEPPVFSTFGDAVSAAMETAEEGDPAAALRDPHPGGDRVEDHRAGDGQCHAEGRAREVLRRRHHA